MSTKLVTSTFETRSADMFVKNIAAEPYYLFVAKHTPFVPDDQHPENINNSMQITTTNTYNNMLFGKRVHSADVLPVVPRYDWVSGTVYSQYNHTDEALLTKNFYAVVQSGSYFNVYKCLFNNNGANSTVQPSGQDTHPFTSPSDGYVWKYLYTFDQPTSTKFETTDFIPVVANTAVANAAIPGSIEVIQVLNGGQGYANYISGSFRAQDLLVNGSDTQYGIADSASNINGFYRNCLIKLTSGAGVNQYRRIIDYVVANGQKIITLDSSFTIAPSTTDNYQIYPAVFTSGDGYETANCVAWAVINPASNTVSSVEVLSSGQNFRVANSVTLSDPTVGVTTNAQFSAIISPICGHGGDIVFELGASKACVSVSFSGSEGNTIPIDNDYRTIGLIKNPRFANVNVAINYATQIGNFVPNETISTFHRKRLTGTGQLIAGNRTIIGTGTDWAEALSLNDQLIITDGTNSLLSSVAAVTNATSITLSSNVSWSNTGCSVAIMTPVANGTLTLANTSILVLDNVSPNFSDTYTHLIGETSGATVDMISTTPRITINGSDVGNFNLFVQMIKVTGTLASGSFIQDEVVTQNTVLNQTAKLFDYTAGSPASIYLTQASETISVNDNIVGQSSGAVFTPANKYGGALKTDSGDIVYIENISPITRASNKSETIKIILEF